MVTKVFDLLQKADILAKQKKWSDAADICIPAQEIEPKNISVLNQLGWYLSRAKRYPEAIEVYKELIQIEPNKAKWPYMLGYQYYDQQKWEKAIDWFNKSLVIYPEYIVALYRKGYAHTQIQEDEDAIKHFSKVISIWQGLDASRKDQENKNYSDASYQLGKLYLKQGLTRKAEYQFSESVQFDQKDAHKYYGYGKSLLRNGKLTESIDQLNMAIKIDSRKDYIKDCLAQAYAENGENEKGIELLEGIPQKFRKHYVWRTLGELYFRSGKFEAATSSLNKALNDQPENHNYLFLLAKAYEGMNKPEKAFPLLKNAIHLREKNYGKDFPEAEEHLNEILIIHPDIEKMNKNVSDGRIKDFKVDRGFGFISSCQYQSDIFFHVSNVLNPDLIRPGQEVQFEVEETTKGLSAVDVKVL